MANKFVAGIVFIFAITSSSCSRRGTAGNSKRRLLLIDTDVGADDAVALMMATEAEKLENGPKIIGITCVNGNANVDVVAMNVLKTLKVVGRLDIPVYKGAAHALLLPDKKDYFFGNDGFGDFPYPNPPSGRLIKAKHAVNAMIELVNEYPGKITLVTLGPLTNVALAIRLYPLFLAKLHQLIVMGGSTEGLGNVRPAIEFNFSTDPAAAYIVFNCSTSKLITLVPYETSMKANLTIEFRKSLSKSHDSKVWLINSAEAVSMHKNNYWISADGVAMSVALTSGSITTKSENYYSEIFWHGRKTAGMVIVDYTNITGNPANTNLIQSINKEAFKNLVWRTFTG